MEAAVRSYFTAGVALTGAAVIAVSPLAPTPAEIQLPAVNISTAAVTLNALTNPLDAWAQTLSSAGENLQALGEQLLANPIPILQTVISNQIGNATVVGNAFQTYGDLVGTTLQGLPAALQTASDLVAEGKITEAMDGLTQELLPAIVGLLDLSNNTWSAVSTTTQNIQNVINAVPTIVASVALPALFPVLSVVNGLAATAQDVVTAANAGDTEGVANALLNAPANLTDAFLNGKGTILGFIDVPGLLSPTSPFGFLGSGPIASALDLPNTIAGLLKPNPLAPKATTAADALSTSAVSTLSPVSSANSAKSARSVTLSIPASDATAETTDTAPVAVKDTAVADSTNATTDADESATATATKSRITAKSPAKSVRDDIRNAVKRISGKSGKNTGSTHADSASSGSSSKASTSSSKHTGSKSHRKSSGSHD